MPRHVRLVLATLGGWVAVDELHALGLSWLPVGPVKWLHLIVMGAAAGLVLLRAAVSPQERAAWLLLGLGVLAWVLGELYFTVALWSDASPPVPSLADAGYLSLPPLVFAGLVVLARSRIRGLPRTLLLDGVTSGLTVAAISAAVVFKPILRAIGGHSLAVATNLCYPASDLLMLGLIGGLLVIGGRRLDRRFFVLAVGIVCFWASDTIYLIRSAQGTWVSGGPYDPGWWTIAICAAGAAWMRQPGRGAAMRHRALISVPIAFAFALASLVILVAGSVTEVSLPAVGLAAAALVSVLARLVLTFRAHQLVLARTRNEASTDPLTGLGNRRALAGAMHQHLVNGGQPTILALFDLNGFKRYNDNFGHAAGDALLQRLATSLRAVLTGRASVYRMGGDEFCALLPGDDDGEALLKAALAVLTDQGDGFAISASLGSVRLPEETQDPEEALRLADQRMYAEKHGSRTARAAHEVKQALVSALAQRDPELGLHLDDVGRLAEQLAREVGCSESLVEQVRIAAELHDVGKMAIPETILTKPGPLTPAEWTMMRQHTVIGERIIASSSALTDIAPLVRSSHERWDGGGYPDRLAGEAIPRGARIITVCDSWHAMTSDRPYRRALSVQDAQAELRAGSGTQFDPGVVEAFLALPGAAGAADRPGVSSTV